MTKATRTTAPRPAAAVVRALRGATSVDADDPELVADAVTELLRALLDRNALAPRDIVSAIFSATPDVRTLYPAAAARRMGFTDLPMLCVSEMSVDGAPPRCIRVLLHLALAEPRLLRAVYLRDAQTLRPDLVELASTAT